MGHGDVCFGNELRDDFVFEPVGVVVGGLAEPTGCQGDPDPVEAPRSIGISHQGVFEAMDFVPVNDRRYLGDELSGPAGDFLDEY